MTGYKNTSEKIYSSLSPFLPTYWCHLLVTMHHAFSEYIYPARLLFAKVWIGLYIPIYIYIITPLLKYP